jgi:hypothetical protein
VRALGTTARAATTAPTDDGFGHDEAPTMPEIPARQQRSGSPPARPRPPEPPELPATKSYPGIGMAAIREACMEGAPSDPDRRIGYRAPHRPAASRSGTYAAAAPQELPSVVIAADDPEPESVEPAPESVEPSAPPTATLPPSAPARQPRSRRVLFSCVLFAGVLLLLALIALLARR